ncbi:hypothetical protein MycrhN_2363 [Mycolicibacterium rhodesiae NBB3]|uniref:DUF4185 domain-containing protein n=1 Tax=Mycolicibacterium rhodesiae (strain NBB3) TaxID=710685 RepID=G8RUA9_MYCRN|nr:DUF4185 domain-containing protein [Mycolicibacterium rhodesiae]AEV72952.1 hypothetical protein MycrhN_2363 [Mycolicibacterium rhodesiae NBB3]
MGPATYIGRVGGLAVALGVGTAIATGHGIAAAQTSDSSAPSSDSSTENTSNPDSTTGSTSTPGVSTANTPTIGTSTIDSSNTETKKSDDDDTDKNETRGAVEPGQVSAQTNTGTLGTSEPAPATEKEEAPKTEPEASGEQPATEEEKEPVVEEEPVERVVEKDDTTGDTTKLDDKKSNNDPISSPPQQSGAVTTTLTGQSTTNPGSTDQEEVVGAATFVDARVLAASGPLNVSPMLAAQTVEDVVVAPETDPDLLTQVVEVVSNVVDSLLNPLAGDVPIDPAAPLAWGLLAFARREVDDLVNALTEGTEEDMTLAPVQTMSLALAAPAPAPPPRPGFPAPGQYLSVSTQFVDWITGNNPANNTQYEWGVTGTDLGIMWDNGMIDDPNTPDVNEHQVLIAFGDTFGVGGMASGTHWRSNVLFRSVDADLFNGLDFTDPEWFTGSDFGGSPLTYVPSGAPYQYMARQIIFPEGLPAGITLIPTAGISVPTPGTEYNVTQYISFMSVTQWGAPGVWTTNYSAIAYSEDNGETWKVAPQSVRYNNATTGNQNFQQMAFVRADGYVYAYGTPNGRQGAAYVARVAERDILDLSKYEYYSAGSAGGMFGVGATPAGWVKGNPAAATPIFGQSTTTPGACGAVNVNPGSAVSEMSVQYNQQLKKFVALHGDRNNNIVMRTSDRPEGGWSGPTVLMSQQNGGIYAPMMHPWSPSTQGTGTDLYWNLSLWSEYNVMLMKTDLSKVK